MGLQWNAIQETFQDIVYCRYGNKNIMININMGATAMSAPPLRSQWLNRRRDFLLSSLSKVALEIKPKCSKNLDSPSLLFFPSSETSQEKVFSKVGVSKFFVEILEKH